LGHPASAPNRSTIASYSQVKEPAWRFHA
jgi:hypothetical protein